MVKVVFIRHGQTEWNVSGRYQGQSDVALSATGIEQAEKLARHFPLAAIDAVYSSDLLRARVTAEKVAGRFGLRVQTDAAFRELNFGDWEGLTYEQIVASWADAMKNFLRHPDILQVPHGESFPEVQQRALNRLRELLVQHEGETIVIVAHGAVLRTLLADALHMPLRCLWSIRQFNTAVNIVRYDAEDRKSVV